MQKRVHNREFKLDIVRQVTTGQKRPAQACREYDIAESVLSRWRKEYQERGESAFQPLQVGGVTTQEQRITELEQFCGQLALENQILKKTLHRLELRSVMK
jgi:putative transposase